MSRRENTCDKRGCAYWVRYGPRCPNYIRSSWTTDSDETYTTIDCAPRRNIILQRQIYNLLVGTRGDMNKLNNVSVKVLQLACSAGPPAELVTDGDYEDQKQIEDKTENGKDTS